MAEHPITPPPELVQQWHAEGFHQDYCSPLKHAIAQAARWGADQELEACVKWIEDCGFHPSIPVEFRAARRPKPSLKEQALGALSRADKDALTNPLTGEVVALRTILNKEQSDTIRRALEALPE